MNIKMAAFLVSILSLLASPLAFAQDDVNMGGGDVEMGGPAPAAPSQAQPANQQGSAGKPPQPGLQPAGQIVWASGTVKATYPDQQPRILTRGAVVYEKDIVATDAGGGGQIAFTDNSMLTLNANSSIAIEQYYFNQQKPTEGGQYVVNLVKGGFRTITGFVAKSAPANYQVKTPVATIGVRGTDFVTSCPRVPGQCAFALLHGLIVIENKTGTYILNPELPFATVESSTTAAVLSKTAPGSLGATPIIAPANAPPPSGGGGNCGILIN